MPRALAAVTAVLSACTSAAAAPFDAPPPDGRLDAKLACTGAETVCDVFLQCGCKSTEKCAPGDNGLVCTAMGAKPPGDVCGGDNECSRGTLCAPYAGTTTCLAFCDDFHPCGTGEFCYVIAKDRAGVAAAHVCGPTCDLRAQDCPGGLACYPTDQYTSLERGICIVPGTNQQSSACQDQSDCAKGLACTVLPGPSGPICAKMCGRTGGPPACDQGRSCQPLTGETQTGVCLP
jgi:hypothetical protein